MKTCDLALRRYLAAMAVLVLCCVALPAVALPAQGSIAHVAPEPGREEARRRVAEEVTQAWARNGGEKEQLRLLVLDCDARGMVYKSEMRQLFPDGTKHLPEQLTPRAIYPTTRNGKTRVQYLGKAVRGGFRFAMFRLLPGGR